MNRKLIASSIILFSFFAGCGATHKILHNKVVSQSAAIEYSVTYYIHADAGYLYHDSDGQPVSANSRVLETAKEVAKNARSGEVFIFYQRPEKKFLGLFPRKSNQFYHYINGEKTTQVAYRHRDKKEPFLTTETLLFNQYGHHNTGADRQHYLLYFGHEIPNDDGTNYHRTLPDIKVSTGSFAEGIHRFLMTDAQKFDLVVLSTCNNGTPVMAWHLIPFTDHLLASPQNLHLSHIDSRKMAGLEQQPRVSPVHLARSMADQTYRRLAANIHTTITLALYDLDPVRSYISELHTSTETHEQSVQNNLIQDLTDCAQFPFFDADAYRIGVTLWYKPARFGRGGQIVTHSGWGCEPLSKNDAVVIN